MGAALPVDWTGFNLMCGNSQSTLQPYVCTKRRNSGALSMQNKKNRTRLVRLFRSAETILALKVIAFG